jgi:hypothetical protein
MRKTRKPDVRSDFQVAGFIGLPGCAGRPGVTYPLPRVFRVPIVWGVDPNCGFRWYASDVRGCQFLFGLLAAGTFCLQAAEPTHPSSLPQWFTVNGDIRYRVEGQHHLGFDEAQSEDFLLQRYRLRIGLAPSRYFRVVGEMQDARVSGLASPDSGVQDPLELRQAYVELGAEKGFAVLRAGRQRIAFGSERVIGAADWGNSARVFDAVDLKLQRGADRVDIFSASVVANNMDSWDHHEQGNNLHGLYASLGSVVPGARLEPYFLVRTMGRRRGESWTPGVRMAGSAGAVWSYEAEALVQNGKLGASPLHAWAATVQVQRTIGHLRWGPAVLGEYNFASGDRRPNDGIVNTFDQLYPTNHGIYGVTDQIGRRNTSNVRSALILHPIKWLTVRGEHHSFWLASRYDGLYAASGAVSVPAVAGGAAHTHVGRELDVVADVKLSRHYGIGAQAGHLIPGAFLQAYSKGAGRTFYVMFVDLHL